MRKLTLFALIALLVLGSGTISAQRPDAPRYAQVGPYAVGFQDVTIESGGDYALDATIWYPAVAGEATAEYRWSLYQLAANAYRDAEPLTTDGPYPLVVFAHGFGGLRFQSIFLMEHLASYGFVVISADHPGSTLLDIRSEEGAIKSFALRPQEVLREIAHVERINKTDLSAIVDMNNIAVMGHSVGGYTALSVGGARLDTSAMDCTDPDEMACIMQEQAAVIAEWRGLDAVPDGVWPATTDPRIRAVVALAPWNGPAFGVDGMTALTLPTLILVGSADDVTLPERDAYFMYENSGSNDKALGVFENAGHYIFVETCNDAALQLGLFDLCSDKVWDLDRAHDITNHLVTAFLLATIKGDAEAKAALETVAFTGFSYEQP